MGKVRSRKARRRRIGRVSIYLHRRRWWVYYREHGRPVRRAVADDEATAEQVAAQLNLELASSAPTFFSFRPISVAELQRAFIDYHEHVVRSSLATVSRYQTATRHLVNFCNIAMAGRPVLAHDIDVEAFVRHLRALRVAPNGHAHAQHRPLRDNGVRYILETCRSMYGYAAKRRHLPPYSENPFSGFGGRRARIDDAKPVFVFTADTELAFLRAAEPWAFGVHFLLAKTGLRVSELTRLLVEDVDLEASWLRIRSRPELSAQTKTRRERDVPLVAEATALLRRLIAGRRGGPVVLRETADSARLRCGGFDSRKLDAEVHLRVAAHEVATDRPTGRRDVARISRKVWRDAGATSNDRVRTAFIRTAAAAGIAGATCPKSWRHTFATLLQDANVDPLIRQLTLGHAPPALFGGSALGMTSVYTHTRPETQHREISRALELWPASLALVAQRAAP